MDVSTNTENKLPPLEMGFDRTLMGQSFAHFILALQKLDDPLDVCESFLTYNPHLDIPSLRHSFLVDGFKRIFEKTLCDQKINSKDILSSKKFQNMMPLLGDILIPWALTILSDPTESRSILKEYAQYIFSFFNNKDHKETFLEQKPYLQHLLEASFQREDGSLIFDYRKLAYMIHNDNPWGLFAFFRFLRLEHVIEVEQSLRTQYAIPPYEPQFNARRTLRFVLFEKLSRHHAKSMKDKIKRHQNRVKKKQIHLASHQRPPLTEHDIEDFLNSKICADLRIHGRTISFIHHGREYLIKLEKIGEVALDTATIQMAQENEEDFYLKNYGQTQYVTLETPILKKLIQLICEDPKNVKKGFHHKMFSSRACLIEINHTRYFDYITNPDIPWAPFISGLQKCSDLLQQQTCLQGRLMSSLSDIAHDLKRPYFWAPFVYLLMSSDGSRQGSLLDLDDSTENPDMNTEGLRDVGDFIELLDMFDDKKYLASIHKYFFDNYEKMLSRDESLQEIERQSENNIQNASIMQLMTPILFLLNRLRNDHEKLQNMTEESFLNIIEKLIVIPFLKHHSLTSLSLDHLRRNYAEHILSDFRAFKKDPHILNETLTHSRQTAVGRDFSFQSFYALSVFLLSTPALYQVQQTSDIKEDEHSKTLSLKRQRVNQKKSDLLSFS